VFKIKCIYSFVDKPEQEKLLTLSMNSINIILMQNILTSVPVSLVKPEPTKSKGSSSLKSVLEEEKGITDLKREKDIS
jgi:hypothetical protein